MSLKKVIRWFNVEFVSTIELDGRYYKVTFSSTGTFFPGSLYGGADHLGWPEELEETRKILSIEPTADVEPESLPVMDLTDETRKRLWNIVDRMDMGLPWSAEEV